MRGACRAAERVGRVPGDRLREQLAAWWGRCLRWAWPGQAGAADSWPAGSAQSRCLRLPAPARRLFLRKLKQVLRIPVLALVDSDPYGLKILSVYMKGEVGVVVNTSPFLAGRRGGRCSTRPVARALRAPGPTISAAARSRAFSPSFLASLPPRFLPCRPQAP